MNTLRFFRHPGDEHYVEQGHVYCPVRNHDVDIDVCLGCGWAIDIDLKAKLPVVRCRPSRLPDWLGRP